MTYAGAEQSLAAVDTELRAAVAAGRPVSALLGFSQGAALAALVLALQERGLRFQVRLRVARRMHEHMGALGRGLTLTLNQSRWETANAASGKRPARGRGEEACGLATRDLMPERGDEGVPDGCN